MTTRSPTAVALASIVPTGSSRTPFARRTNGTRPRQAGRRRWTDRTTRSPAASGPPTNTASIGNRMNIMWIPLLSGSHRPWPSANDGRPIRPMNLSQSPSAASSAPATSVPRETFRARSRASAAIKRPSSAESLRLPWGRREVLHDQDDRRTEDDDEQGRKDAPDEREQHLDRRLRRH